MPTQPWILKPETAAESLRILKEVKAELIPKKGIRCALADALVSGTPCTDPEWLLRIQDVSFHLPGTGGELEVTCTPIFAWVVWVNGIPFAARVPAYNDIGAVGDWQTLEVLGLNDLSRNFKTVMDLSSLSRLRKLRVLNLSHCESLSDLSGLAGLTALQSLDLSHCKSLSDLSVLAGLTALQSFHARDCNRVRTIETLRGCTDLRDLDVSIHPTILSELLADLAGKRRDLTMIRKNAAKWLKEAKSSQLENLPEASVFAASLARAFALLGDISIGDDFQTFLQSAPDFPLKPWKDWFLTTKRESGFGLLQRRIDAIPPAELSPGGIGGACAALPDDQASQPEQTWARAWLAAIEQHHANRGSALRPAAAELCLALARLGEFAALDRWLQRFTDPDDSTAVDQVHAALAEWHIAANRLDDAMKHIAGIGAAAYRDPLLARVARSLAGTAPIQAVETLLLIQDEPIRTRLVREFAESSEMIGSPEAVHRLLVAAGPDGEILAWLLQKVVAEHPEDVVVQELSRQLQLGDEGVWRWWIEQWATIQKDWKLQHEGKAS